MRLSPLTGADRFVPLRPNLISSPLPWPLPLVMNQTVPDDPRRDPVRPPWGLMALVESLALGVGIAGLLAAWGLGLRTCGYDYDEVVRAHSVWLASRGLRPYNDFFEVHPPYFALLVPVIQGRENPLFALRVFATVGNLLFLGGLGVLASTLVEHGRRWAWLGLALVASEPDVLNDLVEFRIDGWGYALAAWGLVRYQRCMPGLRRNAELGVITGLATLLFCPKLTILPALVVLAAQVRGWTSLRRAVQAGLAYLVGVGLAAGLFLGWVVWQGIEPGRLFQLLVRYHAVSGANASFHLGLLQAIRDHHTLLGVTGTGVAAWIIARVVRRSGPGGYELGLLVWLGAQAALVAYPYKQYHAPWFLFAAGFLGYVGAGEATWLRRVRFLPFLIGCGFVVFNATQTSRGWAVGDEARSQEWVLRWIDRVASPTDPIVASAPLHPVDRADTFFIWFNTADPSGFDSEQILARLPSYRDKVTDQQFLSELEAHPPALVLLDGSWRMVPYTRGQLAALSLFLSRRGYQAVNAGPARFAVRPDRLDRTRPQP